MPSREHQWLVLWAARAMVRDGFVVEGYDGPTPQGGTWNELGRPPNIGGFIPDVFGSSNRQAVALGEAKSKNDVLSLHSIAQFAWFARCSAWRGQRLELYIAVPQSATRELDVALAKARLLGSPYVHRIHVPDVLLHEQEGRDEAR